MSVKTTLAQALLYSDAKKRLQLAKKIIIAGTQNIKSIIQYYNRRYDTISNPVIFSVDDSL
jgi:CRISPR/Cas system-associated endonuclease Cas1